MFHSSTIFMVGVQNPKQFHVISPAHSRSLSLKNSYRIVGEVAYLQLTQGQEALVDVEDLERILEHKWWALWDTSGQAFRAVSRIKEDSGKIGALYLHRFLVPSETFIDHENRNPLDNRKCNLREATRSENARNAKRRVDNTSGYKGVHFNRKTLRFQAQIYYNRKQIYLGTFSTPEDAYEAYCKKAYELHGEFACLG